MPALSEMEGADLVAEGGASLGVVERVLFHPTEPRAVALMVERPRALGVVARRTAFIAWPDVSFEQGAVRARTARLPSRGKVEAALGCDVDATVIWRGMPAVSASGGRIGTVGDVGLSDEGGIRMMSVSAGAIGDIAHGRIQVPGELVRGFDGHAVVVDAGAEQLETGGGLARSAAKGAASVKAVASDTAQAAGGALVDASYATGRALATAAKSRPARRARRALKGFADAFREGRDGK